MQPLANMTCGSRVGEAVSSDLTTGRWAPSVDAARREAFPSRQLDEVAEAPLLPIPSGPLHDSQEVAGQPDRSAKSGAG